MPIPIYLAMTAAEISPCGEFPRFFAWMACHFSSSGRGLSNLPPFMPPDSVLMLDDSTPLTGHDQAVIFRQLTETIHKWQLKAILLDFQRPFSMTVRQLAESLQALPCPVVVTPEYAPQNAPVLLPPCPPNRLLAKHIEPFKERKIWLEAASEGIKIRIDRSGFHKEPIAYTNATVFPHWDKKLCCHYCIQRTADAITFYLQRSSEDLQKLLTSPDIVGAIGLWQEFA